jgi:hypothetical protein
MNEVIANCQLPIADSKSVTRYSKGLAIGNSAMIQLAIGNWQ